MTTKPTPTPPAASENKRLHKPRPAYCGNYNSTRDMNNCPWCELSSLRAKLAAAEEAIKEASDNLYDTSAVMHILDAAIDAAKGDE